MIKANAATELWVCNKAIHFWSLFLCVEFSYRDRCCHNQCTFLGRGKRSRKINAFANSKLIELFPTLHELQQGKDPFNDWDVLSWIQVPMWLGRASRLKETSSEERRQRWRLNLDSSHSEVGKMSVVPRTPKSSESQTLEEILSESKEENNLTGAHLSARPGKWTNLWDLGTSFSSQILLLHRRRTLKCLNQHINLMELCFIYSILPWKAQLEQSNCKM